MKNFKNFLNKDPWFSKFRFHQCTVESITCGLIGNVILGLQPQRFWFRDQEWAPKLHFHKRLIQVGWRPHFEKYWRWSQRPICTSTFLSHLFTLKVFSWIFVRNMSKTFLLIIHIVVDKKKSSWNLLWITFILSKLKKKLWCLNNHSVSQML